MKKIIVLFFVFATANAFAQEKWVLGFNLGSNLTGNHVYNLSPRVTTGYKTGLFWGGEAAYSPDEKFTFRVQCFVAQRSVSYNREWVDSSYLNGKYVTFEDSRIWSEGEDYFEIPLTVKYAFTGERSQGYIFAGPVFSFATYSPSNFGITGGIGFSHAFRMVSFFVEGAYTFGLKNIADYAGDDYRRKSDELYYSEFSRDFRINTGLLFTID